MLQRAGKASVVLRGAVDVHSPGELPQVSPHDLDAEHPVLTAHGSQQLVDITGEVLPRIGGDVAAGVEGDGAGWRKVFLRIATAPGPAHSLAE